MSTHEKLARILQHDYKLAPEKLVPEARLEDLGVDSLGVMELLFKIEDEFHIQVPMEQVELATIGDVAGYIDRLMGAQPAADSPRQAV